MSRRTSPSYLVRRAPGQSGPTVAGQPVTSLVLAGRRVAAQVTIEGVEYTFRPALDAGLTAQEVVTGAHVEWIEGGRFPVSRGGTRVLVAEGGTTAVRAALEQHLARRVHAA